MPKADHERILRAFKNMWSAKPTTGSGAVTIDLKIPVDDAALVRSAGLAGFLNEKGCRLRTLDLIQLASAERVARQARKRKGDEKLFVVADRRLAQSAGVLERIAKSMKVVWIDPIGNIRPATEAGLPEQQSSPPGA